MLRRAAWLPLVFVLVSLPAGRAEQKIAVSVGPAATPTPLLAYRLLPDPRELKPGNAAALYYRTEAMFVENAPLLKEFRENYWSEWQAMPLKDLPQAEMDGKIRMARYFLRELEHASLQRDCDWNTSGREEGIGLLLPDVQGFRMFAGVLAAKARLQIARKEYADAVATLRTGYALGRNLGKGPYLIQTLVGVAVVAIMDKQLETMMQQPDAPNLYWAFRTLPRPMFDAEVALIEESDMLERTWPFLRRVDKGILPVEDVQAGMAQLDKLAKDFSLREPPFKNATRAATIVAMHGPAKTWLLENGYPKATVEAMTPVQAVTLSLYKQYRLAHEEWLVWALAGESDSHPGMKAARDKANEAGKVLDRVYFGGLLSGLFDGGVVVAVGKIQEAYRRTERRHVGLATVEAMRLHAAKTGKWPEKLDDITAVPVPVDPVTRKPWDYKRTGDVVTLTSPLADGEKATATSHHVITVGLREK